MAGPEVIFNPYTGRPDEVISDVLRSLSAYTRMDRVKGFKIGISNDPVRRFREGYSDYYDKMVVLYESKSIDSVSRLEKDLIDHNGEFAANMISGGGRALGKAPRWPD